MRSASTIWGLACAMQLQAAARPYWDCAIFVTLSPFWAATLASDFTCCKVDVSVGTTICVPAARRVGSTTDGLAASSSGQREPRPRFCCASFQRESPGCTVTMCRGDNGFTTVDGGPISGPTAVGASGTGADLGDTNFGAAISAGRFVRGVAGAGAGRASSCRAAGAPGAMRAVEGTAGAERRAKGSTRCDGAELEIAGATTTLAWVAATFGRPAEKLG